MGAWRRSLRPSNPIPWVALLVRYGQSSEATIFEWTVQEGIGKAWQYEASDRFQGFWRRFGMALDENQGMLDLVEEPLTQA
jgi:hypothetical protein